jgi:hypothetical protein
MLYPAINPVSLISQKDLERYLQKYSSEKNIIREEFLKGAAYQLELQKKSEQEKEARYLKHLEKKLRELNKQSSHPLDDQKILEITKSAESFNAYFQEESRNVWNGLTEELKKHGANQSFIEGMQKEAAANPSRIFASLVNPFRRFGRALKRKFSGTPTPTPVPTPAPTPANPPSGGGRGFMGFDFSPTKGLAGLGTGALTGAMIGGVPGAVLGGGLGGAFGLLGPAGGGLATIGVPAYLGYKALQGTGLLGKGEERDLSGQLEDRNRLIPGFSNKFIGGAGGALLGNLIASEAGLQGPMSWIAPVLGGIAGHNYLPQMLNKWKDPAGIGANSIGPGAAGINRRIIE